MIIVFLMRHHVVVAPEAGLWQMSVSLYRISLLEVF